MAQQSGLPVQPLGPSTIGNERPSTAWSQEDDTLLMRSRAQGMNWAPIAQNHFPNKSPNACRKRHERLMERKNAENWDGVKLEDLARAYVESREEMWKIIAEKVGEKWQHVENKCMEKGLKTLQAAARSRRTRATSNSPTSPGGGDDENDSGLPPDPPGSDGPDPSSYHQSPSHQSHQQSPHHQPSHRQSHSHHGAPSHHGGSAFPGGTAFQSGPPSSHHGNSPGLEWTPRESGSRSSLGSAAGAYVFPSQSLPGAMGGGSLGGAGGVGGSGGVSGGGHGSGATSGGGGREGPKLPSFSSRFPQQLPGISAMYPQASYC